MENERELAYELREACEIMLSHSVDDASAVIDSMFSIKDILERWRVSEANDELDDE